ncbi:MAG: amidohydrolase family protein [Chthoniobacterales bacterium]
MTLLPLRSQTGRALCASLLFTFATAGCQTQKVRLNPEQEKVRAELAGITPENNSLAESTAIIDVHTHTFNARYLPLEGILLGKRDAYPPVTWLISDNCARTIAAALIERTELSAVGRLPGQARRNMTTQAQEHADSGLVCGVILKLLDKAARAGAWDDRLPMMEQMKRVEEVADQMNAQERLAVMATAHMMGMEAQLKNADRPNALRALVRFLWLITQDDAKMAQFFREEYQGVPMRGTPLLVSHTMDLAPVYDQAPKGNELLDFAQQQVRRIEQFQAAPGSNMIYFVAYNPYRDHWMGGKPGDALAIVRSAVEGHGAWGVKVYPPSGYRAAGNQIEPRPGAFWNKHPAREWDARYGDLGPDANAALDRRLEQLLLWCIANDIPVLVHSGTGEFEARKGYGLYNSNPRFWRRFLESHPAPDGSPCRLRLCLGHAGGEDFWFGEKKNPDWGEEAYELCREFPNVYCEITTHAALVDPGKQAYFVDHLAKCFEDSAADNPGNPRYRYPFSQKLLYGTDWYLPDAASRGSVLTAIEQAFLHPRLRAHYQDYFAGNALRFLNARARLQDSRHPVPGAVRERMERLLR